MQNSKRRNLIIALVVFITALLCSFVISISAKPVYAAETLSAEDAENESNFTFTETVDDEGNASYKVALKAALRSTIQVIIIPETYCGKPVIEIANNGFMSCAKLKKVVVPKTVKKIGKNAFINCKVLERIALPSVEYIDDSAFSMCSSLDKVFLPSAVSYVGSTVFRNNSNSLYIQKSSEEVETEWSSTWSNYQTGDIFYDSLVTDTLEYREIKQNGKVIGVEITENTSLASDDDVVLYNAVKRDGESNYLPLLNICTGAFSYNTLNSLTFRDIQVFDNNAPKFDHKINILSNAFEGAFINVINFEVGISFVHPNEISNVSGFDGEICTSDGSNNSQYIFKDSSVVSVTLPDDLQKITKAMFYSCTSLDNIKVSGQEFDGNNFLPAVDEIGDEAFYACSSLSNIYLPETVKNVGECVFYDWGLAIEQTIIVDCYQDELYQGWSQNWNKDIGQKCTVKYKELSTVALCYYDENNELYKEKDIKLKVGRPMSEININERVGYIFKGIYSEPNGFGTQYYDSNRQSKQNWDDSQNVLYINWEECSTKLKFENGEDSVVKYGEIVPSIGRPTMQPGYEFAGYYMELEDGTRIYYYDNNLVGKKWDRTDKEVFLHVDKKLIDYQINYENITDKEFESCPKSFNVENRTSIVFPNLQRNGYSLEWDIKQIPENYFNNITVTAIWSPNTYYIYFNYDYTDTTNGELKSYEESERAFTVEDEITLSGFTVNGYNFEWDRNQISKGTFEDVYVTGTWSLIEYDINYNLDTKGMENPNSNTYTIEDTIEFVRLTKEHYTFEWVPSKIEKGTTDSQTIEGVWTPKQYYITYNNVTEDTYHNNPQYYTVEDTMHNGIQLSAASRGGYFCEWDINEIPKGCTGDITITAKYTVKTLDQCLNNGVYEIYTPNQFKQIYNQPNGGEGRTYYIMKNLFGLGGFKQIPEFRGTLNGNGHDIEWLNLDVQSDSNVGFCGINYGTIENVCIFADIHASKDYSNVISGIICGINLGTIRDSSACGYGNSPNYWCFAKGESYFGGIAGINKGIIKNCKNSSSMYGSSNMGGIVGLNDGGTIDGCSSYGNIDINYEDYNCCVGGIVAKQIEGTVKNCFYKGTIILLNYFSDKYNSINQDRYIQLCVGIIIGYKQSGSQFANSYENGTGAYGDIVKTNVQLTTVTWKTGALLWQQTHTHDQTLYFRNNVCGRED